ESEEQHLATFVAPERLHRCIVHDLDRTFEGCFEVETSPSFSKIPWLRNRLVPKNWTGITDGNGFVLPIRNELLHASNHLLWRQSRAGLKLTVSLLTGGEDLDVSPSNINYEYVHDRLPGFYAACL